MSDFKEKQLQEIEIRKKAIIKKYNVDEKVFKIVKKYRKDDFYNQVIEEFEKKYNAIVYMVIPDMLGKIIGLLFVGENENQWEDDRPCDELGEIMFVYNEIFDKKEFEICSVKNVEGKLRLNL